MNFNYEIVKENVEDDLLGDYITYGIVATDENNLIIQAVSDVSIDSDVVKNIVKLCNDYQLEPIHLLDVVDDMIGNDIWMQQSVLFYELTAFFI